MRHSILSKIAAAGALLMAVQGMAAAQDVQIVKPTSKHGNAFAIVIDALTFEKTRTQVMDYRDALQDDGLRTYIISGDWTSPDQVRGELVKLNKTAKNLEGIVLVGDIPVVMVRNAQHMTTAFKMDEDKFPREESSVGSDRFYDDLHLQFEYLDKDSTFFYYKLTEDSPQTLAPTFYSGRIKCPPALGVDKYEAIGKFLEKAVEAKRNPDALDNIVTFAGSGYNSDCLITWMDENKTVKENFPGIKDDSRNFKRLRFTMDKFMKYRLFDELERPEVDAFFFNEHGSIHLQHISEMPANATLDETLADLKWSYGGVYHQYSRMLASMDSTEAVARLKAEYHLTDKFFEDFGAAEEISERREAVHDSIYQETVITLDDLRKIAPQPRYVTFNACYNGSFHRPGSISGYYIFGDGRTVATQGNSVNVLQDKWTYEAVGLLALGCRVGEYNRLVATLEGHIIGDPTFHFKPAPNLDFKGEIARHANDVKYWRKHLNSPYAAVQTVAVRRLTELGAMTADEVLGIMHDSAFGTVRMECLKLLSTMDNESRVAAINLGMQDDYEPVRRRAATLVGKCGDPRLFAGLMALRLDRPEQIRVSDYAVSTSVKACDIAKMKKAAEDHLPHMTWLDNRAVLDHTLAEIDEMAEMNDYNLSNIMDKSKKFNTRKMSMRTIRNNNCHESIPDFLAIVADSTEDTGLRVIMTETLGWFTMSYRKDEIVSGLGKILNEDKELPDELRAEIIQSINRLK